MDSSISSRLAFLRVQADDDATSRIAFRKVFITSFIIFAIFSAIVSFFTPDLTDPQNTDPQHARLDRTSLLSEPDPVQETAWDLKTRLEVQNRINWLNDSWLGSSAAEQYRGYANSVTAAIDTSLAVNESLGKIEIAEVDIFSALETFFSRVVVSILLRFGFIFIASWPLWLVGVLGGAAYFYWHLKPGKTTDVLGVCDRNRSPFYSGIYGPFRPNGTASATDFSCPGLACPLQVPVAKASSHNLTKILKHYGALCETTLDLTRIILAYPDFPAIVEEERLVEEDPENLSTSQPVSFARTNAEGTIEQSSVEGLLAILSAHQVLQKYYGQYAPHAETVEAEESLFGTHREKLQKAAAKLNPIARSLLLALTPVRGRALADIAPRTIAAAYLATEAGKCLVFKRDGAHFLQISRFPHLQARAVLQSLLSYHQEFNGEERFTVRQAILSSRRHGDFGRAVLPVNMSIASRALRDFLEVLYWHPEKRRDLAHIVEIDAHIEEIHDNLRDVLTSKLPADHKAMEPDRPLEERLWKGLPFRSVLLVPLRELVGIALSGLSDARIHRVTELMELTRSLSSLMNISARLPGFKRQTTEAERSISESGGITKELAGTEQEKPLIERWLIVRRMLTRYNWLSTRIGDDTVPDDGLVHGIVIDRPTSIDRARSTTALKSRAMGIEALVPIRQRRMKETFGSRWELLYYSDAPHVNSIEIALDSTEYRERLSTRETQAKQGVFDDRLSPMAASQER